ncbi:LuxR C-terminal-related transcriptional regulator [Streptomyces sp. NBC_01210]|uniref:ATP-binding protein n=1 Tax=Streptomyces sp. NBC_01210 TaxID=2903774 RepID=UPI002E161196|nr:LuxR C-terminal-related transcriptional regulator [Streptomyces sp. NBC_01210]
MLSQTRLLTLTGPGGVGKTRLALRLAAHAQRSYPSGVFLVDLAAVETEQALTNAVLEVLGLNHGLGRLTPADLSERMRSKRILIVLDNCEHLLRPCAVLAHTLLEASPELQIIATSRQALGVDGEHLLNVAPLKAPDPDDASCDAAAGHNEALDLFTDRAAHVRGEFALTEADRRVAARICHRLEGVPLAIELAAARLRVLNCEQILRRLDDRFSLLTGGNNVRLPRQQTLRATMDWSFDLCGPQEQLLWARLSVFCGGFDLEAVEAVCSGDGLCREEILDVLAGLTDKSVLIRDECPSQVRYSMLETLRQYGHRRLCDSDELEILYRRHRDYYRALVLQAEAEWLTKQQAAWGVRLRRERSNLRVAMKFCLDEPGESEVGLELAASLWSHRVGAGGLAEERQWLARTLASETAPSRARAKALWADGWLALLCGDTAAAQGRVTECRALAQSLGDPQTNARADQLVGLAALFQDDFSRAVPLLDAALAQYRDHGDAGDSWATLFLLSLASCLGGDPRAAALAQECLDECEASGAQWSHAYALWVVGLHHWLRGEVRSAVRVLRKGLSIGQPSHNRLAAAQCLEVLAWARAKGGHGEEAAQLLGAAQGAWEQVGGTLPGVGQLLHHHAQCERQLRESLGDEDFTARVSAGTALGMEPAVARALGRASDRAAAPDVASKPVLTPREHEVALLLHQGLTDKEIAARLVISPRTAQGHVQRILHKLGFTRRAQVVAWIQERTKHHPAAPG